jgi:serine/threonine protein kinase
MEGRVVGSPEYLSPEQARGDDDLDATTDVWALCVTLYESVTGDLPFHDENYNRLLRHIIEEQPRPITDYAAGDAALWSIISRGLTKHRRGRWPSMEELGRALEGWLQSHGVNDIPRVRFSSLSGVDGEPFSSRTPTRRSDTSDDNDDDAEATLLRVPPPVPGPAPSTAGPKLVVPLPTIIHSKPKPPVSAGTSPVPIPVRMDASPSRVEAPPVYGDTRTTGISFGRLQLGPLKLALLVMGGLAVGGVAVALIVVMLQNVTSPSSTETGSPVIPTTSSDFERESPHLLPQDPTQGITDPPVPSPLPPASAEPPPETSATSPPTVIQRQPRPSKTRPPPIPTAPNF